MNRGHPRIGAIRRRLWRRIRGRLAHAFALPGQADDRQVDDLVLLDRVASLLADRGLATPAIFFVESLAPLGFLGGQLVHLLTPILEAVATPGDIGRLARLLERREAPGLLVERLRRFDEALRLDSGQARQSGPEGARR